MKSRMIGCVLVVGMLAVMGIAMAGDAVEPAKGSVVSMRDEGIQYINSTEYYRGSSLLLTNCIIYAGSTTNVAQGLNNVTVSCKLGIPGSFVAFTGTVDNASAGTWWASFNMPTNWEAPYLQIQLIDEHTNSFIYPWKMIHTKAGM